MSDLIWHDKSFSNTIKLSILSGKQIDEILSLWNENLDFDDDALDAIPRHPLYVYLKYNLNRQPLRNILACVRNHYNAFAIIEDPYLDLEFWDGHSGYYAQSFSQYKISSKRLHFFSSKEKDGEEKYAELLRKLLLQGECRHEIVEQTDLRWRGYCVLRPTHSYVVGRTAIKFDDRCADKMPPEVKRLEEEKGGRPFLKAKQNCSANLLNCCFNIETTEFIQQDPNLGHCATASLWVATQLMANKFGTHRFHYRAITQQALGHWDRERDITTNYDLTDEGGLTPSEIKNAIAATGAKCFTFYPEGDESSEQTFVRLSHEIYSFAESGFPVLLCMSDLHGDSAHVVAVVGHSLPKVESLDDYSNASTLLPEKEIDDEIRRHYLVGNIVKVYYVHNDASGPFNRMVFSQNTSNLVKKDCFCEKFLSKQKKEDGTNDKDFRLRVGGRRLEHKLHKAIVPIEPNVKCSSTHPFRSLMKRFNALYCKAFKKNEIFLWRSLLVEGSEFKQSVCRRDYSPALRKWYASLHLPKYIWLYELTVVRPKEISDYFHHEGYTARLIDGEFIYDATVSSVKTRLLTERFHGSYRDYRRKINEFDKYTDVQRYSCYRAACNRAKIREGDCPCVQNGKKAKVKDTKS